MGLQVVEVDGRPVDNKSVASAMRGAVGSKVLLTFRRTSSNRLYDVMLVRQQSCGVKESHECVSTGLSVP